MSNLKEKQVLDALHAKYDAEECSATINFENYINNGVGVGEHSDVVAECDELLQKIQASWEMKVIITHRLNLLNNGVVLD